MCLCPKAMNNKMGMFSISFCHFLSLLYHFLLLAREQRSHLTGSPCMDTMMIFLPKLGQSNSQDSHACDLCGENGGNCIIIAYLNLDAASLCSPSSSSAIPQKQFHFCCTNTDRTTIMHRHPRSRSIIICKP